MSLTGSRNSSRAEALPLKRAAAPLRHNVVNSLRLSIVNGKLAPGARLVERELIEMLGVSRTLVREALRQLESERLIDVIPNKGAVVRNLTPSEAKEIYAIRAVLEGLAARLFCETASSSQRRALREACSMVEEAYSEGDAQTVIAAKNNFYIILFEGAGMETLRRMVGDLNARIWRWRVLGLAHPNRSSERSRESVSGIRALVATVEAGDAVRAETLAREEVSRAEAEVIRLVAEQQATNK